jgi:hypothetical protein
MISTPSDSLLAYHPGFMCWQLLVLHTWMHHFCSEASQRVGLKAAQRVGIVTQGPYVYRVKNVWLPSCACCCPPPPHLTPPSARLAFKVPALAAASSEELQEHMDTLAQVGGLHEPQLGRVG